MRQPHEKQDIATIQSLPKFELSESVKMQMLERLRTEEENQSAQRPRRSRRAVASRITGALAGASAVGIAAVVMMSTTRTGLGHPFTSGSGSEASGISFPFQPMLPSNADGKYQLTRALATEVLGGKRQQHIAFDAHYQQKGAKAEAFAIHEERQDSLTGGLDGDLSQEVPVTGVKWDKKIDLAGQSGYASHMGGTWKIGFLRDHVSYILSSPKMSEQQLENIAKQVNTPTKVSMMHTMVFPKYDAAVKAITFKPALPKLSANYSLVRSWADITQKDASRTEVLDLTYHFNHTDRTWFDLMESPSPKSSVLMKDYKLAKTVSANGVPVRVYTTGSNDVILAWQSQKSGLYLQLDGTLDVSTMTNIAKSLTP